MLRCLALIALSLAWLGRVSAAEPDYAPTLEALIPKLMSELRVPGAAVVIVQNDKVVFLKGYGVRDAGEKEAVTPDTLFPIASCSKAFTATLLAKLIDEGKLTWDDPVRNHLDYFRLADPLADQEVTLRDLLSHRTGMPRHDGLWASQGSTATEVVKQYGKAAPSSSFRSKWEYANVPFTAAGEVAGTVDGRGWATATQKRLLQPLGMTKTVCTQKEGLASPDHAGAHYRAASGKIVPIEWDAVDHAGGAACVVSCARDMGQWLRFHLAKGKIDDRRLIEAATHKETQIPQMVVRAEGTIAQTFPEEYCRHLSYGLGWFIHDYRGHPIISHGGTLSGFRAQLMLCPEKKLGIFVVANLRPSFFTEIVTRTVIDQALGLSPIDWSAHYQKVTKTAEAEILDTKTRRIINRKPNTRTSYPLTDYAGTYEHPAYGKAVVTAEGESLILKWGRLTYRLDHYHFDTFTATVTAPTIDVVTSDRSNIDVQFQMNGEGNLVGMRFLNQVFVKAKKTS